jgi:kinesin family protein 3/17
MELKKLRAELMAKQKNVVDKEVLLNVERQKKRAEEDKQAAVKELEKRLEELAKEKEEKMRLEAKI